MQQQHPQQQQQQGAALPQQCSAIPAAGSLSRGGAFARHIPGHVRLLQDDGRLQFAVVHQAAPNDLSVGLDQFGVVANRVEIDAQLAEAINQQVRVFMQAPVHDNRHSSRTREVEHAVLAHLAVACGCGTAAETDGPCAVASDVLADAINDLAHDGVA